MTYIATKDNVCAWKYTLEKSVLEVPGDVMLSINAILPTGNMTSYKCKFNVQPSTLPILPPTPAQNVYDIILRYIQQNANSITVIDTRTRNQDASIAAIKTVADDSNAAASAAVNTANIAKTTADTAKAIADTLVDKTATAETNSANAVTTANTANTASATAVDVANTAKTASDKASADVVKLGEQIGSKQGTTVTVGGVPQNTVAFTSDPQTQINDTWKRIYPIGSIYQSINPTSPASLFGGTWQRFSNGRVLVGVDENAPEFNVVQKEGGEKVHVLTPSEVPPMSTLGTVGVPQPSATALYPVLQKEYGSEVVTSFNKAVNYTGGGAHNNLQPYTTVYMWIRTA